ncbi:uncharacterized protein LOC119392846 [Rhipicephalus sanguineus]|uniref:uncharacterized protein LOC119392846 n=1 Tax=Rhipicephalus sanguineus TaxID=34632 RepID=UPI0020C2EFDB|nr:uncharacterized protein LOC119392846 [Rhipicephalus sanguineus]
MVTVAQLQQIAQELHNDIVTTRPDDSDNLEEINSANKLKTLLANALLSLAVKTVTDTADIRAIKELDHFLNRKCHGPHDDQWALPVMLAQSRLNKVSEVRSGGSNRETEAEKSQREQLDIVDGMRKVIRELTDGVLGYVADCEASDASEALRDIACGLRIT